MSKYNGFGVNNLHTFINNIEFTQNTLIIHLKLLVFHQI